MKKVLTVIILSFLVLVIISIYWFYFSQNVKNQVVNHLKENLEFCEIVKDNIDVFNSKGRFWLICNGRPFYAEYENGNIRYELNGWGFLEKQPEILDELKAKKCNFHDLKENNLIFFCSDMTVRMYRFLVYDFKLTKTNTTLLINYLKDLIPYDCIIEGDREFKIDGKNFTQIKMKCKGYETVMVFSLDGMYFFLPTVVDEKFTSEEKVNLSLELIKVCRLEYVEVGTRPYEALTGLDCNLGKVGIIYNFKDGFSSFLFSEAEFEILFPYLRKYIFPFLKAHEIKFLGKKEENSNVLRYYFVGGRVIIASGAKESNLISEVYLKNEGIK